MNFMENNMNTYFRWILIVSLLIMSLSVLDVHEAICIPLFFKNFNAFLKEIKNAFISFLLSNKRKT